MCLVYIIIRNDASNQNFFAHPVRRPKTGDRSGLYASVNQILLCLVSLLAEKRIYMVV